MLDFIYKNKGFPSLFRRIYPFFLKMFYKDVHPRVNNINKTGIFEVHVIGNPSSFFEQVLQIKQGIGFADLPGAMKNNNVFGRNKPFYFIDNFSAVNGFLHCFKYTLY